GTSTWAASRSASCSRLRASRSAKTSAMATSLIGPSATDRAFSAAPVPRPPQPTRATRMVLLSPAWTWGRATPAKADAAAAPAAPRDADPPRYADRWFYASHNLLVDRNADALVALIERAGKSGYNGVVLADYKFNLLGRMPPQYFANARRVRRAADAAGLQ